MSARNPTILSNQDDDYNEPCEQYGWTFPAGRALQSRCAASELHDRMSQSNNHILLLRAPSHTDDHSDPYESEFREHGFTPVSVPVLETAFVDVDDLRACIAGGPTRYAGVITTSARSCEAWANALASTASPGLPLAMYSLKGKSNSGEFR